MAEPFIAQLKQRFGYDEWRDRNTLDENLFIWKFFFSGNEFPDWQPHRIQQIKTPQAPQLNRSIWKPDGGFNEARRTASLAESPPLKQRAEPLLSVDTFECKSRADAHEFLVKILGEFQLPVTIDNDSNIGDISFIGPGNSVIVFARANLVHLIRNAGGSLVGVSDIASRLDSNLISKPEPVMLESIPEIRPFVSRTAARTYRTGEKILLATEINAEPAASGAVMTMAGSAQPMVEGSPPEARPLLYKVFYREGEVFEDDNQEVRQLVYKPSSPGIQEVSVFAVDQSGIAVLQDLALTVD